MVYFLVFILGVITGAVLTIALLIFLAKPGKSRALTKEEWKAGMHPDNSF